MRDREGRIMTEKKYQLIKELASKGVNTKTISEITGFAPSTIGNVKRSANIKEYRERKPNGKKNYTGEAIKEIYQEMESIKDGINQLRAQLVLGVAAKLDQEEEKVGRLIRKLERLDKGEK